MGYLKERIFLCDTHDSYYFDVNVDEGKERIWYCDNSNVFRFCAICFDEKKQLGICEYLEEKYPGKNFLEKVRCYLKGIAPECYTHEIIGLLNVSGTAWRPGLTECRDIVGNDPVGVKAKASYQCIFDAENRCKNLLFELIMNSVEEFQIGKASQITIIKNGSKYEIIDDGSGIPVEDNEEFGDREWKRLLINPHIRYEYSQKCKELFNRYDKAAYYKQCPTFSYKYSIPKGTFYPGQSLAEVQCFSKSMYVKTVRYGKLYTMNFEHGFCVSGRCISDVEDGFPVGTQIVWEPDPHSLTQTKVSFDEILNFSKQQAILNPGLQIFVSDESHDESFCFPNGIVEYMESKVAETFFTPVITRRFDLTAYFPSEEQNHEELEIAVAFAENGFQEAYHNYRKMHFNSDIIETVTEWINHFLAYSRFVIMNKDYLNKSFVTDDISKHFCIAISTRSEYSSYSNETMKSISSEIFDAFIRAGIKGILNQLFKDWSGIRTYPHAKLMIDSLTGMYDGVADKHLMKLNSDPFEKIRSGSKTVELRLFDEKRRMVNVGDFIEFTNNISGEKITVRVTALHKYSSFEELYQVFKRNLEIEKLGYGSGDNPHPDNMKKYYSIEMQEKYGVVGIEFIIL